MHPLPATKTPRTLGIVGGLGSLASGDLFFKLLKTEPALADAGRYRLLFEQRPFKDLALPLTAKASMTSRKLYVFQMCQAYAAQGAHAVLVPCFASQTFLDELRGELDIAVIDLMEALAEHVVRHASPTSRIGVLASDYVRASGLFERAFPNAEILYPRETSQAALMEAVYGKAGIKAGHLEGVSLDLVQQVCLDLQAQGADILLPGMTELSLVSAELERRGVSCIDANRAYAEFAMMSETTPTRAPFKLGIVGGVGPAATVDFMGKVVKNTPATRDQDHIRMVLEQNPQIPDRTAHLLQGEADPTVALYATCKRLESEGADAIAIPCNTAHAFVERIQDHLTIPIVNMLTETLAFIHRTYGSNCRIGLLATTGTIASRVYHQAAERVGLTLMTPDSEAQTWVMEAIYGEQGAKAGHTSGHCATQLRAAVAHLAARGATVLILGCTELPLIIPESHNVAIGDARVTFVDPTQVLAMRCVALAGERDLPQPAAGPRNAVGAQVGCPVSPPGTFT